jgi:hypothetical protein
LHNTYPTTKGMINGPLDEAQHPEPYIAASPTRPFTCKHTICIKVYWIHMTIPRLEKALGENEAVGIRLVPRHCLGVLGVA